MSDLLNQASLVMVPSGYKEDTVYSVVPSDGSGDLSFTRASNGTRVNSAGLVEICPWNLVTNSENFSANYIDINSTISSNTTTAPNGTTTAESILETTATDVHAIRCDYTETSGIAYTYSVYAKTISGRNIQVLGSNGFTGPIARVNLSNGTLLSGSTGASVESVGNGWYRISITETTTTTSIRVIIYSMDGTATTFAGSTSNGVYIYGAQLNIGSTAKPYFPTTDRLNVPRLTYQNGGGGCPSLLLEKQSTNLALWSENFTNAVWALDGDGAGQSVTANYSVSPDGTQNADRIQLSRIGGTYSRIRQVLVAPSTGSISASIYLKTNDNTTKTLNFRLGSAGSEIITVTPNYQRFVITKSVTGGIAYDFELFIDSSTGTTIDLSAWGAQYEASSYPTSYIPTTSSSATRVADACYKTGISSLIGQTAGVVFADFVYLGGVQAVAIELSNSASADDIINLYITSSAATQCYMFDGGSQVGFINSSHTFVKGNRYKIAIGYASNDLVLYINGTQIGTATPSSIPTTSEIYISRDKAASYLTDTKYNEVVIFPTRLTNAELASLTTI